MFKGMSAIRHGKFVSLHLIICEHCLKESVGGGKKRKSSKKKVDIPDMNMTEKLKDTIFLSFHI